MSEQGRKRIVKQPLVGNRFVLKFNKNNSIGYGGNGDVYPVVEIKDRTTEEPFVSDENFVVKVLYKFNRQRKKRFKNEILFLLNNTNSFQNVVKIIDYDKQHYSWYMMKRYKTLDSCKGLSLKEKIVLLLDVAFALKSIHDTDEKHAHRDVKPSNILIDEKGSALLADFGCVFMGNDQLITKSDEYIGPALIRPQELYAYHHNDDIDYRKSDVYLFAKTCWMFLNNNDGGFSGEYNPSNGFVYLRNVFNVETIEPIHELLILSTKEYWEDRITIDDCISLLIKQLTVCEGTIGKKELVELINKENTTKALYTNKSIRNSFGNSPKTCDSFLGKLAKGTCVTIATKTKKEDKKMFFDELHLLQNQTYEILGISDKSYVNKVVFCVGDIEYNFEKEQITVECSLIPNGIQLINQDFMSRTEYLTDENELIITIGTEKNGEDVT